MKDLASYTKTFTQAGINFTVTVSPCSWMYPGYGLQVSIQGENFGQVMALNKPLDFADATPADVDALAVVNLIPCSNKCGRMAFDPAHHRTNRAGQCEVCFLVALNAELESGLAEEKKEDAACDALMAKEGYTHKVVAWVHPSDGGDDYQLVMHSKGEMLPAEIEAALRKKKSRLTNDWKQTAL